jgi:hypothetical protein
MEINRRVIILVFLILFSSISFKKVEAPTSQILQLIKNDVSLTYACSYYKIDFSNFDFNKLGAYSNFSTQLMSLNITNIKEVYGKLNDIDIEILMNKSYEVNVSDYGTCYQDILINDTNFTCPLTCSSNNTTYCLNCSYPCIIGYHLEKRYEDVYDWFIKKDFISKNYSINLNLSFLDLFNDVKVKKYLEFRICGHYNFTRTPDGWGIAIDHIPSFNNVDYPFYTWWNSSFTRRKQINITNSGTSNLTDYQVYLNITYDSDMQPNFADIRFSYYNQTTGTETEIPYWLQNKVDSTWATFWVKVPFIRTSTYGNEIIYIYYKNTTTVTSASNGKATFLFFDDFNDNSINTTIWSSTGGVAEQNQRLEVTTDSNGAVWNSVSMQTAYNVTPPILVHIDVLTDTTFTNSYWEIHMGEDGIGATWGQGFGHYQTAWAYPNANGGSGTWTSPPTPSASTWYELVEKLPDATHSKAFINGTQYGNKTFTTALSNIRYGIGASNQLPKYDNFFIAKYSEPIPTYTIGSEELPLQTYSRSLFDYPTYNEILLKLTNILKIISDYITSNELIIRIQNSIGIVTNYITHNELILKILNSFKIPFDYITQNEILIRITYSIRTVTNYIIPNEISTRLLNSIRIIANYITSNELISKILNLFKIIFNYITQNELISKIFNQIRTLTDTLFTYNTNNWWNTSFIKRIQINITNPNPSNLTNYSTLINITYDSNMNIDVSDIRFTYYNQTTSNETEIPYWVESYSTSNITVWVNIPFIRNSTYGNEIIYIYYGNITTVTSKSNGNTTFPFFENFTETLSNGFINTNGSPTGTYCGGKVAQSGLPSPKYLPYWSGQTDWDCEEYRVNTSINTFILEPTRGGQGHSMNAYSNNLYSTLGSPDQYRIRANMSGYNVSTENVGYGIHNGTTNIFMIRASNENYSVNESGQLPSISGTTWNLSAFAWDMAVDTPTEILYTKWVLLRRYISTEPTYTIGSEESYYNELIIRIQNSIRLLTNYITQNELLLFLYQKVGAIVVTSQITFNEISTKLLNSIKITSEYIISNELITRVQNSIRVIFNYITYNEIISKLFQSIRNVTNYITYNEISTKILNSIKIVLNYITSNELITRIQNSIRIISNYIISNELSIKILNSIKIVTNYITSNEITTKIQNSIRIISNYITSNEITIKISNLIKILTDNITHNEIITKITYSIKIVTNYISQNELVVSLKNQIRYLSNYITSNELTVKIYNMVISVIDYITHNSGISGTWLCQIGISCPSAITIITANYTSYYRERPTITFLTSQNLTLTVYKYHSPEVFVGIYNVTNGTTIQLPPNTIYKFNFQSPFHQSQDISLLLNKDTIIIINLPYNYLFYLAIFIPIILFIRTYYKRKKLKEVRKK